MLGLCMLMASPMMRAQRRHGSSPLDTIGEAPSQKDGWEALKTFRSLRMAGDYAFRFQLKIMPRREKTRTVPGVLYGTMNDQGPLTRIDVALKEPAVGDHAELIPGETLRLLLQNGHFARAFKSEDGVNGGVPWVVSSDHYFDPIAGSNFTVFDLLMPFTFWQRFLYEGRTTFRGRPTHVFWMYPPKEDTLMQKRVSGVRLYLDEEFYALIQAEIYGPDKELAKTVTIVDFKKVDGEWILGQVDVRDEATRDKTRFKVIDARMNLNLPPSIFTMQGLTETVYGRDPASVAVSPADGAKPGAESRGR